jgi:hypothetical protein
MLRCATPGPWRKVGESFVVSDSYSVAEILSPDRHAADHALIRAAPELVRRLADEVEALWSVMACFASDSEAYQAGRTQGALSERRRLDDCLSMMTQSGALYRGANLRPAGISREAERAVIGAILTQLRNSPDGQSHNVFMPIEDARLKLARCREALRQIVAMLPTDFHPSCNHGKLLDEACGLAQQALAE